MENWGEKGQDGAGKAPCNLRAVRFWEETLGFLICDRGGIIVLISKGCWED